MGDSLINLALAARVEKWREPAQADGVVIVSGADLKPQPVSWLWNGWFARGKLHILAGAPGQGKTTIAIKIAATVTRGGLFPDGTRCDRGNVLIWSGEDDPADTLLPRLIAAGGDPSRVRFITGAIVNGGRLPFDPARDMSGLVAAIEPIGGIDLLIVDPIVSAVSGDSHKNTEVRRALQPIVHLAEAVGAAVLGITHFSKGGAGRDPTERVTGSVAFGAVARVVMVAAKVQADDGTDRRIFARSKSNIGPDDGGFVYALEQVEALPGIEASRVIWGEAVQGAARELLTEADSQGEGDAGADTAGAVDALRYILSTGTTPSAEAQAAMKAEGFTDKMTRTARAKLGVRVQRSGFGKDMRSYWTLPGSAPSDGSIPALDAIPAHTCPQNRKAGMGTNGEKGTNGEAPSDLPKMPHAPEGAEHANSQRVTPSASSASLVASLGDLPADSEAVE